METVRVPFVLIIYIGAGAAGKRKRFPVSATGPRPALPGTLGIFGAAGLGDHCTGGGAHYPHPGIPWGARSTIRDARSTVRLVSPYESARE